MKEEGGFGRGAAGGGWVRRGRPARTVGGGLAEYSGMFFSMFLGAEIFLNRYVCMSVCLYVCMSQILGEIIFKED